MSAMARGNGRGGRGARGGRGGPGGGFGPHGLGTPVEKAKNFRKTLRRLLNYLSAEKYLLIVVVIAAAISTVFSIVGPKILGLATTRLFEGVMKRLMHVPGATIDFEYIVQVLLILVALYAISALFMFVQQYIMAGVAQRTVYRLRREVVGKLDRLPLSFYDSRTHGELMSRAVNDLDAISNTLQMSVTQLITSVLSLLGFLVMMLTISWLLTLVVMVTIPLSLVVTLMAAKRSQTYFAQQQKSLGELNGHVEETYSGHQIVKAFGHEQEAITTFDSLNGKLYDAGWRAQFVSGMIMPLMNAIGNLGYVLVAVIGGIMVTQKGITIGDVQAFIQYGRQFTQPITQLASIANSIQLTIAAAERVFELLDEKEEVLEAAEPETLAQPQGHVRFQNVDFTYKPDASLIENLNIDVKSGQTIAIVGPTGAGKTTLVNLLMRFYELKGGKITIDGVDIVKFRRGHLRRMFGMVLQDTWLFTGTVRDNIAYGRANATEQEIIRASKAAQADHFIRTLPDSYQTVLNEAATNISQGQKQLLTIARAFLADPAILILDEATSSVDTRTEVLIQKAMHELMKGRTSFIIAHRLSTIRDADTILVMNNGAIIEQGTHEELLAKHGFYDELYQSQFAGRDLAAVAM